MDTYSSGWTLSQVITRYNYDSAPHMYMVVLKNGTAQGAMIYPSAFIPMIDDLPECVKTALFTDDSMLLVEGKYVSHLGKIA